MTIQLPGRTAFIAVDVQNDFCEGGNLAVAGGAAVAAEITAHLQSAAYDLRIATRDWHVDPGAHFDDWPVHCKVGTAGVEYHPNLDTSLFEVHIRKGEYEAAYSGFEGVEGVSDMTAAGPRKTLVEVLTEAGVTHVVIGGIATDHCIRATALDAVKAGFVTTVATDLIAGVAPDTTAAALAEMDAAGITLISTVDLAA